MIVVVVVLSATVAGKVGAASLLDIFHMADQAYPGIGAFPGKDPASPTTSVWLMTSAVNIALGNWVFPHLFQMCYSAQSATAIRRNAVWQPLYSLAYFFIILLGFAALLAACSRPTTISTRRCCIRRHVLSGVGDRRVAGTGFLLALVPGSLLLLRPARSSRAISRSRSAGPCRKRLPCACRARRWCFAALAAFLSISDGSSWCASCSMLTRRSACWRRRCSGIPVAARDGIRRAGRAGGGFRRLAGAVRVQLLVPRRARMGAGIDRHGHQCAGPDSRESSDADAATVRGGHRHSFNVAPSPRRKSNNLTR